VSDQIPPSRQALREALQLSDDLLRNIELTDIPLANAALKASRLARLLNDFDHQRALEYESSGYPQTPGGVPSDIYALAVLAGREFEEKDSKTGEVKRFIYCTSIDELDQQSRSADVSLAAARDPHVSIASANPYQRVASPTGNFMERDRIRRSASLALSRLSSRRTFIYSYVLRRHHELKFSGIADDIFSRIRETVDSQIGARVPTAAQQLVAVYANLQSENPEDWSNAVHSCRRILQSMADAIYPARNDVTKTIDGKERTIKLGPDHYINRLIAFLEEKASSHRFRDIVGSHLSFIGDRLDSVFSAAQKGSHAIVNREEADRYVVYTYLVVGDILSLL